MKRFLLVLFLSFFFYGYSQPWLSYLPQKKDKNYTLTDYQRAFEQYERDFKAKHPDFKTGEAEEELEFGVPGYAQFKRWEWYWEPRVDPVTKEFPEKTAWEIWQEYKKKYNVKSVGGNWVNLGPANINQDDRGTGRLNCAAFDPNDDNHFWVGAPAGGLWETTDGGNTWTCLTDANPILGVSDIAIPPDYNASTNPVIYIATGDRDAGDDPSIGILKTTDGGATWQRTGLQFPAKSGVRIGRIIINPNDKNIMWAATSVGIYKSTDAGDTWTFKQGGNFIDMELVPGSTSNGDGILYATNYGWDPKVYKTTDGGENWNVVFDFANVSGNQFRCDVAVTPANPDVAYIITADGDNNMAFYGLYRTDDQGNTWTQVYSQSDNNLYGWYESNSASSGGQGWYDVALAVSNTDEDVVYVGGVNGYISTDGGQSFTICNQWTTGISTADVVHADHHNAYFRPSDNRLFDCNDGGFNYSDNVTAGKSSDWYNLTAGLINGQIYDIGVGQQSAKEVVAGFQDNGTKLLDNSATNSWLDVKGGDGMCCAIDPTDDNVQWGTYVQLQIDYTTNKWGSASSIRSSGGAAWAGPLEADPQGNNTIYIGTDRVERYVGSSNTDLTGTALDADYLRALDVYNDGTNLVIWTAGPNGCWKSDNTGRNYTKVNGLPPNMVTDIAIDEDDYNHVYVCFGGYDDVVVYETRDGGATWTDISEGLPPVPAGAIVINEQNTSKDEVYVGTDAGIYVKLGDAPWQLFNNGMPFVSITDLEFYYDNANPANTRLRAATYGRGVWETDCYEPPAFDACLTEIIIPESEYCGVEDITPTIKFSNIGTTTLTSVTINYQIDGGSVVSQNWSGSLAQGQSETVTFPNITLTYGHHTIKAWLSNPNGNAGDDNADNDTKTKEYDVWNISLPYTQTFDDFVLNVGYNGTPVELQECWTNDPNESSLDWSVNQGQTPSANTGPDGDHTSGAGKYLYTEVSGISSATTVNVLSPVFDLTNYQNAQVSFWYCMNGASCGSLQIDLYYGGAWHNAISASWNGTTATSISGNQGTGWYEVVADISAADGYNDVQVRISSTTGTNYDGDIAIDDFNLTADPVCTPPSTQASNLSATPDYTSITLTWDRGDGDNVLVVAREGSSVNADPVSGTSYTANSTFGSGDQIGTGNYVVYNGNGTSVTVDGLTEGTTYYFAIYEYYNTDVCYLIPGATTNATTKVYPPSITDVTPNSFYADKGAQLTITGTHLDNVTSVTLGGVSGTINSQTATTLTVTFPAGYYTDNTLTVTNAGGDATSTVTVNKRNIIPVGGGTDYHTTIQSALDGLYAWYGNTSFDAGQLPGEKVIEIYNGTYTETVTPNTNLAPTSADMLIIRNHSGDSPEIDATGLDYGIYIGALDYVKVSGLTIHNANEANIYTEGDYNEITFNKCYSSASGDGIKLNAANNSTVTNNLVYSNYDYGIHIVSSDNVVVKNNTAYDNGHSITGPQTLTYSFSGSVAIQDNTTVYADINVPDDVVITKVRVVDMNITHSYDSDLDIYLQHPDGTEVELSTGNGGSGDNYTNTTFDDDATTSITSGSAPFTGTFKPEGTLADLNGKSSLGTWRLKVTDNYSGDEGTIDSWNLEITYDANDNVGAGLCVESGTGTVVENNIFVAKAGTDYVTLETPSGITVSSDYNTYYKNGNTNLVNYNGTLYADLAAWSGNGAGANDLESDPLFVNPGTDFHIQSEYGSYQGGEWPPLTTNSGTWTNDAATSPALDAGNPADPYSNEPVSGNRINQGCYGNTVQASKSHPPDIVWDGSESSDWFTAANWTPEQVPTSSDNVNIPNGCPNYPVINNGISNVAECNDMTIESGASVTIDPNGYMTVYGTINNNAGTSGLVIHSDATGTGSLIHNSSSAVSATVERYLPAVTKAWHMVSAPISDAPMSVFPTTNNLYYYDETTDDFWHGNEYGALSTMGWTAPSEATMVVNRGYLFNFFPTTLTFQGTLNNSNAASSISISYTDHNGTGAANSTYNYDDMDGWNLIGNPFTSAIDWALVDANAANLYDAIYFYDDVNQTYVSYVDGTDSYDGTGTNGATQYIPAMQGFFVKGNKTLGLGGTLTIPANARVHNAQAFWKSKDEQNDFLRLKITANNYSDETVVRLYDQATDRFDDNMDAYKLFSMQYGVPQIYTTDGNYTEYSVNTVKYQEGTVIQVPLNILNFDGEYQIEVETFNFDKTKVYLTDNISGERIALSKGKVISGVYQPLEWPQTRYVLTFVTPASAPTNITETKEISVYPNPNNGFFYLSVNKDLKDFTVNIIDATGKVVFTKHYNTNGVKELNLSGLATGVYTLKLESANLVHTEKVIIR